MIHSTDVERINALVGGGFCAIVSLSDAPNENDNNAKGMDCRTHSRNHTLGKEIENQKSVSYNPQLSKDKSVGKKFESVTVRVINGQTDIFKHFNQMNVSKS